MVAIVLGARLQAGQVRTGVRFRIQLAPDFFGRQNPLQEAFLLVMGPVVDDGRPDNRQAEPIYGRGGVRARHFVRHDGLLHWTRVLTTVLLRPAHADETGLVQFAMPRHTRVKRVQFLFGRVVFEPLTHPLAKGDVFGGEVQIHRFSFYG